MKYKINMYGEGVRIWLCHVDDEMFKRMDIARNQLPWELVLFDLEFLEYFGYKNWSELSTSKEMIGFYLYDKNIIEIKNANKRLSKFFASDLIDSNVLFPVHATALTKIVPSIDFTFILMEYETGLIMSYTLETTEFDPDDLKYNLSELNGKKFLREVLYKEQILTNTKTETVTRGNRVLCK